MRCRGSSGPLVRTSALIGLLCFTGMRPGEAYALRRRHVDLTAGAAIIARTWDWRGKIFTDRRPRRPIVQSRSRAGACRNSRRTSSAPMRPATN
jgi:integrase